MTTTAIEFCAGLCKSADHYTIYPYSYNHDDSYTDNYYVKCSYDNKQDIYYFVGRNYNSRYTWREISESEYLSPSSGDFYYSDTGSDLVGSAVPRYVHTFGVDLFGCFLVGAVLSAILGGVLRKCLN